MKKFVIALVLILYICNVTYAEVGLGDIQKVVREENKKTIDEFDAKLAQTEKDIEKQTIDFANRVMVDISKMITDTEKKIILISGVSLVGILLLVEGILGFIRIRREQNVFLLLKKDMDNINIHISNVEKELTDLRVKQLEKINIENKKIEEAKEIEKQNKIKELQEQINKLNEKPIVIPVKEEEIVAPIYVKEEKVKKGFFGKKKVV